MDLSAQVDCHEYVLMPWDDKTTIIVRENGNVSRAYSRWDLIQKQLSSSEILNVEDLVNVIKSYNVAFEKTGQQRTPQWKCIVLHEYFAHLNEFEKKNFFEENGILSTIRNLSLQLRELVPRLKLLRRGFNSSIKLHQKQIASILGNAFFCTFPKGTANCPLINFNTLYEGSYESVLEYFIEKIKCLINYFKRIHAKEPVGNLSFHRLNIPDHKFPRWDKTTANLCSLKVDVEGKIEDQEGYLQMDFANKYVGGGVLGKGCVQEEIRFLVCPELIVTRLFTECLADNESLFVVGAERYCHYKGYSNTFAFAGDYFDITPFDENGQRKTYIIILDALYFHHSSDQYRESKILRELKKAYVGFKLLEQYRTLPLATGNWGCGAFGGDAQLKALLQLMACSQAHRDMLYLTFGNFSLKNQIEELYITLNKKSVNIGMLYRIIRLYNRERKKNQTVFEFVLASVNKLEENKPSQTKPFMPKCKVEKQNPCEETPSENFPPMDIDFDALDIEIQVTSKSCTLNEYRPDGSSNHPSKQKSGISHENTSIIDVMWYENELDFVKSSKEHNGENLNSARKHSMHKGNSSNMIFEKDMEMSIDSLENHTPKAGNAAITSGFGQHQQTLKNENETNCKVQRKKIIQPKITDCFLKK